MNMIREYYTRKAYQLYPFRWTFVIALAGSFFGLWVHSSAFFLAVHVFIHAWSILALAIIIYYGPVRRLAGTLMVEGGRPLAWPFILFFHAGLVILTVGVLYGILFG